MQADIQTNGQTDRHTHHNTSNLSGKRSKKTKQSERNISARQSDSAIPCRCAAPVRATSLTKTLRAVWHDEDPSVLVCINLASSIIPKSSSWSPRDIRWWRSSPATSAAPSPDFCKQCFNFHLPPTVVYSWCGLYIHLYSSLMVAWNEKKKKERNKTIT